MMLYLVPTPIGNLGDLTQRALEVLKSVEIIAAEDTRRTRHLLTHFAIPYPERLITYCEHREESAGRYLVDLLRQGKNVALCTDGGFPGISDPGYRLVTAVIEAGLPFSVLPGASAVPVALVSSGLPTSSYTFKGYPPRRGGPRRRFLETEKNSPHTLVLFESPFRVASTLEAALEVLGDRRAAVCLELTKKFETITRGTLSELVAKFRDRNVKGEVSLVIEGNRDKRAAAEEDEEDESREPEVANPEEPQERKQEQDTNEDRPW